MMGAPGASHLGTWETSAGWRTLSKPIKVGAPSLPILETWETTTGGWPRSQ